MKPFFVFLFCLLSTFIISQTAPAVYDDIVFDEEEIKASFKPGNKKFINLKSKKGISGMPKTSTADSIKTINITEIILVFTETTEDAATTREESNRERWENLLMTYPEFFQFSTTYKNVCQCDIGGNAEAYKTTQGFYIYFKTPEEKAAEIAAEKAAREKEELAEKAKEEAAAKKAETKPDKKEDKKTVEEKTVAKTEKKEKEKKVETKAEEDESSTAVEGAEQTVAVTIVPKKSGYSKPKVSKNKKACRPPCYEGGDEGLHNFFKDQIAVDRKIKRAIKGSSSVVKLSLNFDGTIKKALVNGTNAKLNDLVTVAVRNMDTWYPAVKGGVTVKSEVKITLMYDKGTKAIRPFEIIITPRPNPKCIECKTDNEIFGD